jgi:endonuclease/exonuclease/phosphatase (EEP) superfamily protein YafD
MRVIFLIVVLVGMVSCSNSNSTKGNTNSTSYLSLNSRGSKITIKKKAKTKGSLKLVSWNLNFGLGGDHEMIQTMGKFNCDAIFLQETTPLWERAIRKKLSGKFPHMKFVNRGGAGGIAVLSKHTIDTMEIITPPDGGWFPAILTTLTINKNSVQILNVHLHPPFDNNGSLVKGYFSSKSLRVKEVKKFYQKMNKKLPLVILGDFNEEKSGKSIKYLKGKGFSTSLSSQNTWRWKTSFYITLRSQLDHVLYNKRLLLEKAKVLKTGRSDHFPVIVNFYFLK